MFHRDVVKLVWFNQHHYFLTANVLREVSYYLQLKQVLIASVDDALTIYTFPDQQKLVINLSVRFTDGTRHCWIPDGHVLFVGGGSYLKRIPVNANVYDWNSVSLEVREMAQMAEARYSPGVISLKNSVFVFGGYKESAKKSCEKFSCDSKAWSYLPEMANERHSFSPCEYRGKVYLPDVSKSHGVMESFDVEREQFEVEQVQLPKSENNSVSFVLDSRMVILSCNLRGWEWDFEAEELREFMVKGRNQCLSSCSPVLIGETEFAWIEFNSGIVATFDLQTLLLNTLNL